MSLFDDNEELVVRGRSPNGELVIRELPKLVVTPTSGGIPIIKVSNQSQYRITKDETGRHPLTDKSDAVLPPKYKGDHTFDPTNRVFEPTPVKLEMANERPISSESQQNVNPNLKPQELVKEGANQLQMPERSLFGGGSSGGNSSPKSSDTPGDKAPSSLFEPSGSSGNSEGSLFVIIIASLAVVLTAVLKFISHIFWPLISRARFRRRRFRFSRR